MAPDDPTGGRTAFNGILKKIQKNAEILAEFTVEELNALNV